MSGQQNNGNDHFTQSQVTQQDPSMDWTSEPLNMTSIRDDFRAFFGQTEEEWDAQMSAFPTYEEWVGQSGNGNAAPSMFLTEDEQMVDDDYAAAAATCIDPALLIDLANVPAGSPSANSITPNLMQPTEYIMSDAVSGVGVLQAPAPTGTDPTGPTNVPESHETTEPTDSTEPTEHDTRIQSQLQELISSLGDLELMHNEARTELTSERRRGAVYRTAWHGLKLKRLEALQQDEVSNAMTDLEADYKECRTQLDAERMRGYKLSAHMLRARRERSWAMVRLVEVEQENLKWQGKYDALERRWQSKNETLDCKWQKKYDAFELKWQKKYEAPNHPAEKKYKAAAAEVDRLQKEVNRLYEELEKVGQLKTGYFLRKRT